VVYDLKAQSSYDLVVDNEAFPGQFDQIEITNDGQYMITMLTNQRSLSCIRLLAKPAFTASKRLPRTSRSQESN